jgi:hypothetical protein
MLFAITLLLVDAIVVLGQQYCWKEILADSLINCRENSITRSKPLAFSPLLFLSDMDGNQNIVPLWK